MKRIMTLVCAFSISVGTMGYAAQNGNQGNGRRFEQDRRGPGQGQERGRDRELRDREPKEVRAAEKREEKINRFEDRMERNPELRAKVERLLPAGTNLSDAASGFKNQGQFIAALHVSKNLGIPFDQLKLKMTGPEPMSLGQAVHELKPGLSDKESRLEAERAQNQARATERN